MLARVQRELERPILMGHSMGGGTVGWAGVKRPDAFRALVLEDSGTSPPTEGFDPAERRRLRDGFNKWLRGLQAQSVDELVAGLETSLRLLAISVSPPEMLPWD